MPLLLETKNLTKTYSWGKHSKPALKKIQLSLEHGSTLGLVGESGSGKTTLAHLLCLLEEPNAGEILYKGIDICKLKGKDLHGIRKSVQIVFQDPYSSLNPCKKVIDAVVEGYLIHKIMKKKDAYLAAKELLLKLGIPVEYHIKFPFELSGGQRQRVCIARALAVEPELLILDEPLSALDVSIQLQIIELLKRIQEERKISYLFISHDLPMVRYFCDRVVVLYQGEVVESAEVVEIFSSPKHPYTKLLLDSVPEPDPILERKKQMPSTK